MLCYMISPPDALMQGSKLAHFFGVVPLDGQVAAFFYYVADQRDHVSWTWLPAPILQFTSASNFVTTDEEGWRYFKRTTLMSS